MAMAGSTIKVEQGGDSQSDEADLLKNLFKSERKKFVQSLDQPRKKKRKTGGRVKGVKNGSSCHHCKRSGRLLCYCTNHVFIGRSNTARPCTKKYCIKCLSRVYAGMFQEEIDNDRFVCPACKGICSCAACRRKEMRRRLKADGIDPDKMKEAKELSNTQAPNIEFLTKGGMDSQREQASNLLSVLADKPRARKVIRAAMEMKFTDRNNKVLYVAHIIRQVLRLDIDQYYNECEERQEKEVEKIMKQQAEEQAQLEAQLASGMVAPNVDMSALGAMGGVGGPGPEALEKLQRLQLLLARLKDTGVPIPDNLVHEKAEQMVKQEEELELRAGGVGSSAPFLPGRA